MRRKNGKIKGKSMEKVTEPNGGRRGANTKSKPQSKKKRQSRKRKWKKAAGTARNRQRKSCIMQSWERAVFSPRFLVSLYEIGGGFGMEDR
ncbi:MAG: hypothetical protein U0M89_14365 [Bacteroides caccae]|uniref:hypothetical protein n=2 Tax=Bacteroides caccae TaxID=47678 RepID=UPI001F0018A9|nr:hypothetical protein [Bacteroides caccae]MEE0760694.1 hypothetical protein [Bacteroides caccae]